jgi:hypothetical protein
MPLTFGQKAVGYNSNPNAAAIKEMEDVRQQYAKMIDDIWDKHIASIESMGRGEAAAMAEFSIRHLQEASYWLIKAITWTK